MPNPKIDRQPLLKIHSLLPTLKSAERRLAEYVLKHPTETITATIDDLATVSGCSLATISRFCKKLGYSGYKEFRTLLVEDVVARNSDAITPGDLAVDRNSPPEEVADKVFRFSERIIRETESFFDPDTIQTAAQKILACRRLLFIGLGTSGISARYAHSRFFRLGLFCSAETDPVLFSMESAMMIEEDLLFAVSSSGRTSSVVAAAEKAKQRGATVIALSDYAISPLNTIAGINLYTTPRNTEFYMNVEMPLLIGQISLIDILFSMVSLMAADEGDNLYRLSKDAADGMKD